MSNGSYEARMDAMSDFITESASEYIADNLDDVVKDYLDDIIKTLEKMGYRVSK